jgi:hypothetical protein
VPLLGELVFDPYGRVGHHDPLDDSFRFQLSQPLRQHPVADLGDRRPQLRKPQPAVHQEMDERAGPPPADELDGMVELGAELGFVAHAAILPYRGT